MIWIIVAVVAVVIIAALLLWQQKRRTSTLKDRFGPEYERTVAESDGRRDAEKELDQRQERRSQLDIRPLQAATRDRFAASWRTAQERFVDRPDEAVREADVLVAEVMRERGYPVDDFETRAADISVDHPHLVENYRAAHGISLAQEHDKASTEDLRQAMVHYRSLFEELLGESSGDDRLTA